MYIVDFDIPESEHKLLGFVEYQYSISIHHKTHSFQKVVLVGIRRKNL